MKVDKLILTVICKKYNELIYKHYGRKLKKSIRYYLRAIMFVLRNGCSWDALKDTKWNDVDPSTIRRFHNKLCKGKVYDAAYYELFTDHYFVLEDIRNQKIFNMDSTMIRNSMGKNLKGRIYNDRGRKGLKMSNIVDRYGVPINMPLISPPNVHDKLLIEKTTDTLIIKPKNMIIVADAGYENETIKNKIKSLHNINLIANKRKDTRKKLTNSQKKKLKQRTIVEHFYSWIKKYKRLNTMMDKHIETYIGFTMLAYMSILCKKLG